MGSIFREKDPIRNAVDTLSVPRPRARAGRCGARHLPVCQGDSRQHRRQDHARLIVPQTEPYSPFTRDNLLRLQLYLILIKPLMSQIEFVDHDFEKRRCWNGENRSG